MKRAEAKKIIAVHRKTVQFYSFIRRIAGKVEAEAYAKNCFEKLPKGGEM